MNAKIIEFIPKIKLFIQTYSQRLLSIAILLIISDILFLQDKSDLVFFPILALYLLCIKLYKLPSSLTFIICLFTLLVMFFLFIFTSTSIATEKAATWLFFLILVGTIQAIKEK